MAADNETRLLSRVIRDRSITPLFLRGVQDSWFVSVEDQAVWKFVKNHWTKYAEVPSAVTVKDNFPNYRLLKVEDSIEYLLDQLLSYQRRQSTFSIVKDAANRLSDSNDYEGALQVLSTGLAKLEGDGIGGTADLDLTASAVDRWEEYQTRKNLPGGLLGLTTGFPTIDKATLGLQKGQLITIIAPPKTGKSTLALQVAKSIHDAGGVPYFRSFEMSNLEQLSRYDAMMAGIGHTRLISGQLNSAEEMKYKDSLRKLTRSGHKFWLGDSAAGTTVSALAAKIQYHKPDILFVDGTYLLIDEQSGESNTPQALTNITRGLKRLAQRENIPVVNSTQTLLWKMKKGAVTADSIGYSSSFFQDSDVILGLQKLSDDLDDIRLLKVVASRNCPNTEAQLLWNWEEGEFKEMDSEEEE